MDRLSQQVANKASRAVDQLRDHCSGALDYSAASLGVVEDMLAEASHVTDRMPEDQIDALVRIIGSYFLEVARREFGGEYYWYKEHDQPVLAVGEPNFKIAILAFDKVRGRLFGDSADNIPFFYDGFATRARAAKPGDDVLFV